MEKKKKNIEWLLGLCVLIGMIGVFFLARDFGYTVYANEPMGTDAETVIEIQVEEGDSAMAVAKKLDAKDLIPSKAAFCFRAKFSKYDGLIKAGTYELRETMGIDDILASITQSE